MGEIRRKLRWVYLAKRKKPLSPKALKNDNGNTIRKIFNKSIYIYMHIYSDVNRRDSRLR